MQPIRTSTGGSPGKKAGAPMSTKQADVGGPVPGPASVGQLALVTTWY